MHTFSDMKSGLDIRPSGNVDVVYDENVILQSLRNIFATVTGERVRNPIGSKLVRLLFEQMSQQTARKIERELRRVIGLYEPRVVIRSLTISPIFDTNAYDVVITMNITGINKSATFRNRLRSLAVR